VVFRLWAPEAETVKLRIGAGQIIGMTRTPDGYFNSRVLSAAPGERYSFELDGNGPFPDPASRYQPEGVHGPSEIVDPSTYQWHDEDWVGLVQQDLIFYELHVGAFTTAGTFRAAAEKLPYLKDLGITAVELMPLADFPGDRNWGYDGVCLFAPARCYGTPDDLRSLVDQAHELGLAVFVDAVYNHFGPDGAYQGSFSQHYFTKRHQNPWGDAINFDAPLNSHVREYFLENALRWIYEYHVDGLRLDATHAIKDDSSRLFLAELASAIHHASTDLKRRIYVIAEDARNLPQLITPACCGGVGLDGVWADDFHHQMRRALAGDSDGYFAEFEGTTRAIVQTINRGWKRGSAPTGLEYSKFIYCIQNHDQIGNRALGDRLNHTVDPAVYRVASALLLLLPQTPLLFMGQEWAAATPFLYFTDHHSDLGTLVTEGRRQEFGHFSSFSSAEVPDPQAPETFRASQLNWSELTLEPHASILRLYRSLLTLRKTEAALRYCGTTPQLRIEARDDATILLNRTSADGLAGIMALFRLYGSGQLNVKDQSFLKSAIWSSEDPAFAPDSQCIEINSVESIVSFRRPGAIIFRSTEREGL